MNQKDQTWAIFWCSLLQPVLFGEIEPKEIQGFLKKLAQQHRCFPNGVRKTPSLSTLRRKLRAYREGGLEALARKGRSDRAKPRAHPETLVQRAIQLRQHQPLRTGHAINQFLKVEYGTTIPTSTLYRYLRNAGATRRKLGVSNNKLRRR